MFKNQAEVDAKYSKNKPEAYVPDVTDMPDGEINSSERGSGFTANQQAELRRMTLMARAQGRQWTFHYRTKEVPIVEETFLKLEGDILPTVDLMGAIPHRNGFIDGYGVACYQAMGRNTDAIRFVLYRDGVESKCQFLVTAQDNKTNLNGNSGGCVRARMFNTNPGLYTIEHENDVFPFRAQERLAVRAMASLNQEHSFPTNVDELILWLYPVFEVWSPDTSEAQKYGGGLPDNIPGGGADENGGGGGGTGGGGGGIITT